MNISSMLGSFIIGCLVCAILTGTAVRYDSSNSWIPIAALFVCLAYLGFILRSAISVINKRLEKMERQN
jgi:hypothetical protein